MFPAITCTCIYNFFDVESPAFQSWSTSLICMYIHNVVLTYHNVAHSKLDAFLHRTERVQLHIMYRHCKYASTYALQLEFTCRDALAWFVCNLASVYSLVGKSISSTISVMASNLVWGISKWLLHCCFAFLLCYVVLCCLALLSI